METKGEYLTLEQMRTGIKYCKDNPMPDKFYVRVSLWQIIKYLLTGKF